LVAPTSLGLRERSGATLTLCEQPKATAPCSSVDIYERYRDRFQSIFSGARSRCSDMGQSKEQLA